MNSINYKGYKLTYGGIKELTIIYKLLKIQEKYCYNKDEINKLLKEIEDIVSKMEPEDQLYFSVADLDDLIGE